MELNEKIYSFITGGDYIIRLWRKSLLDQRRISLSAYQTLAHNNAAAIMDAWQLQNEINNTIPPEAYKETHQHLKNAIDYYVNNTRQTEKALF